MGPDVRRKPAP